MKSAIAATLIVCLLGAALPVAAQDQTHPAAGPLARAITREAVRVATEPTSSSVRQIGKPDSNWSRVSKLAPGIEIVVTVRSSQPGKRYFVRADESELTVLNLSNLTLPAAVTRVLRDIASNHREYFERAEKGETFLLDNVRLVPDGVFVADRKVADLGQIIETIARNDVAQIKTVTIRGWPGALLGGAGGFALGVTLAHTMECAEADFVKCMVLDLFSVPVGAAIAGYFAFRHKTEHVIYSAP